MPPIFRTLVRYLLRQQHCCRFELEQIQRSDILSLSLKRHTGLLALPVETLVRILEQLDWDDVLRIRQCSRVLASATHARSIWVTMLERYTQTWFPRPFWLPKPLTACTSSDVERIITRWCTSAAELASGTVQQSEVEVPPLEDLDLSVPLRPLPGSRFFLVATANGTIWCHDSQSHDRPPEALFDTPFERPNQRIRAKINFDCLSMLGPGEIAPKTFNAAIIWRRYIDSATSEYVVEVWEVQPRMTDEGIQGYSSRRLASFMGDSSDGPLSSLSLYGNHVAYVNFCASTVVTDWTQFPAANPGPGKAEPCCRFSSYFMGSAHENCVLLPGKRMAVPTNGGIYVYDWSQCTQSTLPGCAVTPARCKPIWSHKWDKLSRQDFWSVTPFLVNDTIRLVVPGPTGIVGIILPNTFDPATHTVEMVSLYQEDGMRGRSLNFYGYHKGISATPSDAKAMQYSCPDEHSAPPTTTVILSGNQYWDGEVIQFNE